MGALILCANLQPLRLGSKFGTKNFAFFVKNQDSTCILKRFFSICAITKTSDNYVYSGIL